MGENWRTLIKRLSIAYETGWQYIEDSEEAGSVLTNVFLEMERKNQIRCDKIWDKHKYIFGQVMPGSARNPIRHKSGVIIKATGENDKKDIEAETGLYTVTEQGIPIHFQTVCPVKLTSARLRYVIYCKGLSAWLSYEEEAGIQKQIPLFSPVGKELCHPVFCWKFCGLCDGRKSFCFEAQFEKKDYPKQELSGQWTITDGETIFPAEWERIQDGFLLKGETPEFADNLEGNMYEVRLEFPAGEEPSKDWLDILCSDFMLKETVDLCTPDLCLTDFDAGDGEIVFPFGRTMTEASCCYLACDRVMMAGEREIVICFSEKFETEEKLPDPNPAGYEKLYKKYPWLKNRESVQEWYAENTVWEYFDGNMWRLLPGSEKWQTGCKSDVPGEKTYRWKRPKDMQPCAVEGKEHFYIRLRLSKVCNDYASFYRKKIPVLEKIQFKTEPLCMVSTKRQIPDCSLAEEEKMLFGFDREITSHNCWYTGERIYDFHNNRIMGKSRIFGLEAFWAEQKEMKETYLSCFLPNYVPVIPVFTETDEEYLKQQICKGAAFYVETKDMGVLDAVCTTDMDYESTDFANRKDDQIPEYYLSHLERLLTPFDMEIMLRQRYPQIRIDSCMFSDKGRALRVYAFFEGNAKKNNMAEWELKEQKKRLAEIEEWLENILSQSGPLWLRDCHVKFSLRNTKKVGEADNDRTEIAG